MYEKFHCCVSKNLPYRQTILLLFQLYKQITTGWGGGEQNKQK